VLDETTQAESTGRLLEWHPGETASAIRMDAGPVYQNARLERLLVHTAGYTLDVFDVATTDGAPHHIDWIYHNDGRAASPLALAPYAALPAQNGYQYLSDPRAAVTAAAWEATFAQKDNGLRLHMMGAKDTTVVLGQGLGQDLTVPVPFALARRSGTSARFVAVLQPFQGSPARLKVSMINSDTMGVEAGGATDEIVIAPGRFKFTRLRASTATP